MTNWDRRVRSVGAGGVIRGEIWPTISQGRYVHKGGGTGAQCEK